MATHVADTPNQGNIESVIRYAAQIGLITDADLATDLATVKANVTTRAASVHQDKRGFLPMLLDAITRGFGQAPAAMIGGSLSSLYTALDGTWAAGMA